MKITESELFYFKRWVYRLGTNNNQEQIIQ